MTLLDVQMAQPVMAQTQPMLMSVQVPQGMMGGMMIQVQTPAGLKRVQKGAGPRGFCQTQRVLTKHRHPRRPCLLRRRVSLLLRRISLLLRRVSLLLRQVSLLLRR